MSSIARRDILRLTLFAPLASAVPMCLSSCRKGYGNDPSTVFPPSADFGPLLDPDANGVRLPSGFSSRIVARSGEEPVTGSGYPWHDSPDGGATFPTADGGWIYVSNSEVSSGGGGVGAIRFDAGANIIAAYPVLQNTTRNCAGGPTPWGTWLSCEEIPLGHVWECDPYGILSPRELPALGSYAHEAAAVDPATGNVYLTEDVPDGRFYRFFPAANTLSGHPDLSDGTLQVAQVEGPDGGSVAWHAVPDPGGTMVATRYQVSSSTPFNGAEGAWYDSNQVYFSTKGDNRIWMLDIVSDELFVIYDANEVSNPVLLGVDNITVSPRGDIMVAEDGDDMQLVAITVAGRVVPVLQLVGHDGSEITGPAFDPGGSRLYFSSQDGTTGAGSAAGITFEVTGNFFGS